ncbi:MAG: DUF1801 domain-containing protein [Phycisphaerales bacterium]|jgi:uncharacterized protein YdhG (YjbR/CyaY superfamily)|nr:DUF1801 domain-containing protein [Phycisphaerales bacterium]
MAKKKSATKRRGSARQAEPRTSPARPRRARSGPKSPRPDTPIDEYLKKCKPDQRRTLESLRRQILAVARGAEERISYQIAAFRYAGRMLVGMGASPAHCTFYLMSTRVMKSFAAELASYKVGKGSIRFQADRPLPTPLVRRLVMARIQENSSDLRS